jgi:hypothetical protein
MSGRIIAAIAGSFGGTVTTLIFQHFMVIKPLMDMLAVCQGRG